MRCPAEKSHLVTLTQLRAERCKPAPGQQPSDRYWQGVGWVGRRPNLALAAAIAGAARPEGTRHRACFDAFWCREIVVALAKGVASDALPANGD